MDAFNSNEQLKIGTRVRPGGGPWCRVQAVRAPLWSGMCRRVLCLLLCGLILSPASARSDSGKTFADLSIEELMNESVRSVAKREQRMADVASAVTVLTNDDLRRSGADSIAEALRLVPGLDVASYNAREWSISSRGFNNLYANKLLVLVDGRVVYTPLFAGVYWDLQQTALEDIDRVEVIRGPGATVWGANAVNGVINVATQSAKDTQGGLLSTRVSGEGNAANVRYGGRVGASTYYRVFGGYQSTSEHPLSNGQGAGDDWRAWHGGARVDSYPQADIRMTWQAEATGASSRIRNDALNVNTLGRWTKRISARSSLEAQAYFDRDHHDEVVRGRATINTSDLSFQHTFGLGETNDVIWGIGYRHIANELDMANPAVQVRDRRLSQQLFNGFVQDEIQLVPRRASLTVGTKIEDNDTTGFEVQPSLRAVVKPAEGHSIWAASSRSVRTPNLIEGKDAVGVAYGEPFPGPGGGLYVPTLVGNPKVDSDVQWASEIGYRAQFSRRASLDFTAFYNRYSHMISFGPVMRLLPGVPVGVAEIPWQNVFHGNTRGAEVTINVSPRDAWRLTGSYSLLLARFGPASPDTFTLENDSPRHQAMLRSSFDFTRRLSLDTQVRHVSQILGVPAYYEADVRLSYRANDRLEFSLVGKNLLHRQHREQAPLAYATMTEVPRSITGRIAWRF